jgi:hypothetical protein
MKLNVITLALAATALGALAAHAQTTVIQQGPPPLVVERPPVVVTTPPAVVVEPPATSTTVKHNNLGILGNSTHTTTTTTTGTGVDCTRQTVQTNTLLGSSTNSNTTCQ